MNTNCRINFGRYISSLVLSHSTLILPPLISLSSLTISQHSFFMIVFPFTSSSSLRSQREEEGHRTICHRLSPPGITRRSFFGSILLFLAPCFFLPFFHTNLRSISFNAYYSTTFNVVLICCNFVLQPIHVPTWLEWMFPYFPLFHSRFLPHSFPTRFHSSKNKEPPQGTTSFSSLILFSILELRTVLCRTRQNLVYSVLLISIWRQN